MQGCGRRPRVGGRVVALRRRNRGGHVVVAAEAAREHEGAAGQGRPEGVVVRGAQPAELAEALDAGVGARAGGRDEGGEGDGKGGEGAERRASGHERRAA
jgi:hypothetical protein